MAKKKYKTPRGSVWLNGKRKGVHLARGYYVRKRMSGPRRFRLLEFKKSGRIHDFDSPQAAKALGWIKL